jgi:cytochrome c5
MISSARLFVFCAALVAQSACSRSQDRPAPAAPPAAEAPATAASPVPAPAGDPLDRARKIYRLRCRNCHGENGRGDGPMAAAMPRRPRDHTDRGWQGTVTDERIAQVIREGGPAIGLSPSMPAHADLSPEDLQALVALIRSFAAAPAPAQ